MDKSTNSLNWFDVPAKDIVRAKKFYENIFAMKMGEMQNIMGMKMVEFPQDPGNGKANGALVQSNDHIPSMEGCVIYLNANPDMQPMVDKIEKFGCMLLMTKTQVSPEIGFMGFFIDSEGNKMALQSNN